MKPKVIVIGAGLGGLSTALRLQHQGFEVEIFEKGPRPGGRSNRIDENGFHVDTGPTILVMKDAFTEFYRSIGLEFEQRLSLVQIEPNYRIYFHDGSFIDLSSVMPRLAAEAEKIKPGAGEQVFQFLGASSRKYALGMDFVNRNFDHITDLANPIAGLRLLQTSAHQNLYRQVASFFDGDDRLAKAFSFHSMFLGLSPFDALAMYSLITYADLALGMWYPMGGIYAIVEDMLLIAEESGVRLHLNAPVEQILIENKQARGVVLESGERFLADLVISNADLPYTYRSLIDPQHRRRYTDRRLESMDYACSGYLLYLGLDTVYPHLRHQSLYFSEDYRANLDAIFKTNTLPQDPSFHLNVPTTTDPSLAPPGGSLLYLLAPMPNLSAGIDWDQAAVVVREQLFNRLEQIVSPDIRRHIVWQHEYLPTDFKTDYNAVFGTAFGSLSQSFFQSAYFRPHNKSREVAGLYFVGQGTYPGIGMPMVMISSKLVAERILQEWT